MSPSNRRKFSRIISQWLKSYCKPLISILFASSCTLSASVSIATEADFAKEIVIDAKKQSMDIKNHTITFSGDVTVAQGTMSIHANTLKMYTKNKESKGHEIIIATGSPAKYSQELDNGQTITAQADEIRYDLGNKTLRLTGNAQLNQNDSLVKGNQISYHLINQELIAEGSKATDGVVTTIFKPEKSDKK